jgi:hypothetical protein
LNITLIAIDNKVSGVSDTRLGDMKAIIANTIATAPKPIFVKGVTFLLQPDRFFVVVVVLVKPTQDNNSKVLTVYKLASEENLEFSFSIQRNSVSELKVY